MADRVALAGRVACATCYIICICASVHVFVVVRGQTQVCVCSPRALAPLPRAFHSIICNQSTMTMLAVQCISTMRAAVTRSHRACHTAWLVQPVQPHSPILAPRTPHHTLRTCTINKPSPTMVTALPVEMAVLADLDASTARTLSFILRPLFTIANLLFIVRIVLTWFPEQVRTTLPSAAPTPLPGWQAIPVVAELHTHRATAGSHPQGGPAPGGRGRFPHRVGGAAFLFQRDPAGPARHPQPDRAAGTALALYRCDCCTSLCCCSHRSMKHTPCPLHSHIKVGLS